MSKQPHRGQIVPASALLIPFPSSARWYPRGPCGNPKKRGSKGTMKRIAWKILATLLVTIACALPAAAQYDETAKSFHLLPHLADGGGWRSVLLVTNTSQSASSCTFNVYGMALNRFQELSSFVTAAGSTATFQLEGPGGYLIWPTNNELAAVASGYATLDCSAPVVAQVVFASFDGFRVTGMATVFSSQAATVFQIPVLRPAATLGFAIANNTNAEASCRIVLEDSQRTNLGEAMLSVPAKSNKSQLLNNAISIPGTFLGGVAVILCNQPVAMIGLHFELRPDGTIITFTTLPPAILSTIPVSLTPAPPPPPPPTATGDPWSRPNIERFRGTWQFTYTRFGAAITDTFVLNIVIEQTAAPGEWGIGGLQDDGSIAALLYNHNLNSYLLLTTDDPGAGIYTLNLTSPITVSGCYREILAGNQVSSCLYPMAGVKTSSSTSSTLSSLKRAQPNTTAAHTELDSKIIRVLEDLREVEGQRGAYPVGMGGSGTF